MLTHALFYEPNATPTTDIDLRVYCLPEWKEKLKGNIGLHAGSKILRVKGKNKIQDKGALFFGLSGTGKTTLTCHTHGLRRPEGIVIKQDDVVILKKDGSCFGTENNFYIKTEGLTAKQQPLLYNATMHNTAILENICVNLNGDIDFLNNFYGTRKISHITEVLSLDENGRYILQDIFKFEQKGISPEGKIIGEMVPTGKLPSFMKEIKVNNINLGEDIFKVDS